MELEEILNNNIIISKRRIHDCQATVGAETLTQGVRSLATNDCGTYEYNNGSTNLWDKDNSKIQDTILDSVLGVTISGLLTSSVNNNRLKVEIEIPSPTPIIAKTKILEIVRTDQIGEDYFFQLYNGTAMKQYGAKIYLTAMDGNISLNNKSILITQ